MGTPQKSIGNHLVLWPIKLYYNYTKEPQNSIGNYLGTYIAHLGFLFELRFPSASTAAFTRSCHTMAKN